MGKKDKNRLRGAGAEKTVQKTNKKLEAKQKKMLQKLGEQDIVEVVAKLEAEEARRKTVTETISTPPTPRSNFSLCAHPDKEELILFGGEFFNGNEVTIYNELFFYNIAKDEWKSVRSPAGPAPRSSHQMVAVANDGGQLWIFGGEHPSPSQMQFFHYRDLWVYRLAEKKWEKVSATGGPSARSGHRMVAIKKKLFVFGGFYDSGISYTYFNDVWMFSMETYTWHEIKCEGVIKPAPRSAGCMAATPDGKLLVWGGYSRTSVKKDIDRGVTHSDMFVLTPEKKDESGLVWKWSTVKPGGFKPMPRSGVGLTTTANGIGYTFGGVVDVDEDEENVLGNFSNDMYSIDLAKPTWRYIELNPKGTKSKGAAAGKDQEMTDAQPVEKMSDNAVFKMVVGGGPSSFTGVFGQAPKPKVLPGNVPSPRMNASLVVCKKHLYLYGGIVEDGNKQFTLADLYSLDLHKLDQWKTIIAKDTIAHEWLDNSDEDDSSDSEDEDEDEDDGENEDDDDEDHNDDWADSDEMDTD